jgi:alginate O-acetyltransferase complex protein AlgI
MIFSSVEFIIFFVFISFLIKVLPKHQTTILILSSLFFYSYWNPIFTILIIFFFLSTYLFINKNSSLKLSISIILLPLVYFKYSLFLTEILNLEYLNIYSYKGDLPLAISFITFTAIALLIDIKRKTYEENLNFKDIAEFILYFPQLIAGPILRAHQLIPELRKKIIFKTDNFKIGLVLFLIGFVKKIFFADTIASIIDPIFLDPSYYESKDLFKAYILFPFQIYFDFSGYVDMALGVSSILGINLPINFNKPYLTTSLTEFWRNWHITLSNWFRDYIYIPLGGSKASQQKLYFNLLLTMSIAGLWHGASINFILWGFLNGIFLCLEKTFKKLFNLNHLLKIFINCFLIFNLWVIFRISDFSSLLNFFSILYSNYFSVFEGENLLLIIIAVILVLSQKFDNYEFLKSMSKKINLSILVPIFIIIIITGLGISAGTSEKFIYFDF